jgi:hypothetical protein
MTRNDPPPVPSPPTPKKINVAVLLILAAVFVTVPLLIFAGLFLWLEQSSFASVDEIKPAELDGVRVQMLNLVRGPQNRPDPAADESLSPDENTPAYHDPDIGPVNLIRPDFEVMLQPLRDAQPADPKDWPATAFLGELRVRYKDGRRGTIYLRQARDNPRDPDSPMRVYMVIGPNKYKACSLRELRTFAEACAGRGTPAGR